MRSSTAPINRTAFDAWVETELAPTLRQGDVVILDNLAVHRSPGAETILREKRAWFPAFAPLWRAIGELPPRGGVRVRLNPRRGNLRVPVPPVAYASCI